MIYPLLAFISLFFSSWAMYTDIRHRIITNQINLLALFCVILIVLYGFLYTDQNILSHLYAGAISVLVMAIAFYFNIIGGGDAKLLMVLGFTVPVRFLIYLWLYIAIVGGGVALFYKLKGENTIPYGIAIWGGVLVFWVQWFLKI